MEYVYPAIFHKNLDDGSYTILYPDLPGCISEGKSLKNAFFMARSISKEWLTYLRDKRMEIPSASALEDIKVSDGEFVNLISAEVKDAKAVKRTVSIPKWMDDKAVQSGLSLSRVLQEALAEKLA
jgi:predicted RNase H-like HicB family nuclease